MLTPQELLEIVDTLHPQIDELNAWITTDLISRIMARLGRGEELMLTGTDQWQIEVYKSAGGHFEALQKEIQCFTKKTDEEIKAVFEDAAIRAWEDDDAFYISRGFDSVRLLHSENMLKLLADMHERTNGEIHNFTRTTARASQQRLIKVLDKAHFKVMSGAQSYTQAVADAVNEIAEEQTKVIYPSGHTDVRTGVAQASGNMSLQGMIEHDWDLIRVSAHLGARYGDGGENPGNHFWWQGKLYSRTGKTAGYPLFAETTGYGTGEGLCGWNCRHSFGPGDPDHNPYADFDAEENKRVYDLSQKQRNAEAKIRRAKLKVLGLREALDKAENGQLKSKLQEDYNKAALRLHKYNAEYNKFCDDNNLKKLYDRISVAKWTRSQAMKAVSAVASVDKARKQAYNIFKDNIHEQIKKDYLLTVNIGMQNKHIRGSPNFDPTHSELTANPEDLIKLYAGKSEPRMTKAGEWNHKEYFVHTSEIGIYRDIEGNKFPTTTGMIHFSKTKGIHIVPARPLKGDTKND